MSKTPSKIDALTSLRLLASLWVFLLHVLPVCLGVKFALLPGFIQNSVTLGYTAVPFFFSLSGFVLFYHFQNSEIDSARKLKLFYKSRFLRIAPAFFLSLALTAFFFFLLKTTPPLNSILSAFGFHILFLSAWVPNALLVNYPAWSISAEMFFYALFPFFMRPLKRVNRISTLLMILGVVFLLGFLIQFLGCQFFPYLSTWPHSMEIEQINSLEAKFFQLNPIAHLTEFIFGMVVARIFLLWPTEQKRNSGNFLFLASLSLWLGCSFFSEKFSYLQLNSFLLLPLFGVILFSAGSLAGNTRRAFSSRLSVYGGEISYAIYVFHLPVRDLWEIYFQDHGANPWFKLFLNLICTLILSILCTELVDKKLRSKANINE